MNTATSPKLCFVIGAIGSKDSAERVRADWLKHNIIGPVLENPPFSYLVKRADDFTDPGLITDQVIVSALDASLVVADLTGFNPNAFYELGIRHMVEKPVIHMIEEGTVLPFDVKDYRAIFYKLTTYKDHQAARDELTKQVTAVEAEGHKVHNPVTRARGSQQLSESSDPKDKMLADLVRSVGGLDAQVRGLSQDVSRLKMITLALTGGHYTTGGIAELLGASAGYTFPGVGPDRSARVDNPLARAVSDIVLRDYNPPKG